MKRKISIVLLLAMCLSLFAGCTIIPNKTPEASQGLLDAKAYLDSYMRDVPAATTVSFDVLGVVAVAGVFYQVEWTTDNAAITLTRDDENGLVKVSVPACGDVAVNYTLTATVSEASGATVTSVFNYTVPAADYVISAPQPGVAYKLGMYSTAKSAAYYFMGEMSGYYGATSTAFSKGVDVYVEVVDGGYQLYFNDASGAKKYISVVPSGTHRNFVFNADTPSVFVFETEYASFSTMVDVDGTQEKCYMGTSANYVTVGAFNKIAADTYFVHLYVNDANHGEGEPSDGPTQPTTPPAADPTPDTELSILDAFNLGKSKDHNVYTEGKYYIVGEITEVYNTTYGNMYVKDANGNTLTIYGTWSADGSLKYDALTTKPVAGDTVKLYGIIGQYNGTPQMKNAWIVEINGSSTNEPSEQPTETPSEEPTTAPAECPLVPGTAYTISATNGKGELFFNGTVSSGRFNGVYDAANATRVYIEVVDGGYLIYFNNGTKTYIKMDDSSTGGALVTDAASATVFEWNATIKTLVVAEDANNRTFGVSANSTYDNFSCYDISNTYNWGQFVAVDGEPSEDPSEEPSEEPSQEPSEEPSVNPGAPFANGDKVVIVCRAHNKALSSVMTGYYLSGVDVTVTDGVVSGYADTEVWTVIANTDGSYSFAIGGNNLGINAGYSSMSLGAADDDWKLVPQDNGTYALQSTTRGNYIEWYASKNNWSTYNPSTLSDLFYLDFYVVG